MMFYTELEWILGDFIKLEMKKCRLIKAGSNAGGTVIFAME